MATTTNYSWTTPDDTALVKDGAAAIRTLGSSIDTTTKALNPSTTLGDIEYRSSTANTNTILGIGTTGQVLTVSGGVPAWATSSSGGMTLISTTTLTGSSITLSSIPQTYNHLQLVIKNNRPATDGDNIWMRFNADSGTRYRTVGWGTGNGAQAFNGTELDLAANIDNGASTALIISDIYDYSNTTTWKMQVSTAMVNNDTTPTDLTSVKYVGYYNQTAAISSITISSAYTNFTSGTVLLYGVK